MNDDFERTVSDAFRTAEAATAHSAPDADWDDLSSRIEQRHRRQRHVLASCAVIVALATGVSGYAIGNRGGGTLTVKSDSPSTAGGSGSNGNEKPAVPPGPDTIQGVAATGFGVNGAGIDGSGGFGTKLISRRTAAGLEIRSALTTFPSDVGGANGGAGLPPECTSVGNIMYAVVTDDDVAQGGTSTTAATRPIVTLSSTTGLTGTQTLTVVVTGVDAASVSATFPNGTVDSMSPVSKTVILASAASTGDVNNWAATKVSFSDAGGAAHEVPLDVVMVASTAPTADGTQLPHIDCTPRLPAPGVQPADPEAAKAAVISSFTRLYDPKVPDSDKLGLVDDPSGVQAAWEAARTGPYAEAAKASEFKLVDLVFTAPDEAMVKYDILLPSGSTPVGSLTGQIGTAKLVDGTWKVTHSTICSVLSMAGSGCAGTPDTPTVTFSAGSGSGGLTVESPTPAK